MKKMLLLISMTLSALFVSAQFTPNNIAVLVAGDGSRSTNGADPLSIVEYTPIGAQVGSPLLLPTETNEATGNKRILGAVSRTSNYGLLSLSQDANALSLIGYDVAPNAGTTEVNNSTTRVIALIDIGKNINTQYAVGTENANIRRALFHNSYIYTIGSAGGIRVLNTTDNSTESVSGAAGAPRSIGIYNGQLYAATNTSTYRVYTVGVEVPTTSATATRLPGLDDATASGLDPYEFIFFDTDGVNGPDLLYVADNVAGIRKFWFNGTAWENKGTFATGDLRDLTGRYSATTGAALYAVTNTTLYKFEDTAAPSENISVAEAQVLQTAAPNTAFKGVSLTPGSSLLPVKLTSFNGKLEGNHVELNWTTASEKNNSHFDILRSANGKTFDKIGFVQGSGTSDITNNYIYTDRFPYKGDNYYKLKQVDFNGNLEESKVISVKALSNEKEIKVYQQDNAVSVQVYSAVNGSGTLSITDISGKIISSRKVDLTAGNNQFDAGLGTVPKGVYLVKMLSAGKTLSTKFIK